MKKYTFEVCANSVASCVEAQRGGADRVELCAAIPEGGTTPSYGEIVMARRGIDIRLHVIIRPRGGDFLYTSTELETMLLDIDMARQAGADGVVFGCLTPGGTVDMSAMKRLIEAAKGLSVTFHRAFDMCADPVEALEQLISLGCDRVLTSGAEATAQLGVPLLKKLVIQAAGRIIIMPGCGVNESNIAAIAAETGATEFHMSARSTSPSGMVFRNGRISMGGTVTIDEYAHQLTDAGVLARIISKLPTDIK